MRGAQSPSQPIVSLATRVDLATDRLRRSLQRRTGLPAPKLLSEALRAYERMLDADCKQEEATA
jgi:hypothetical protein